MNLGSAPPSRGTLPRSAIAAVIASTAIVVLGLVALGAVLLLSPEPVTVATAAAPEAPHAGASPEDISTPAADTPRAAPPMPPGASALQTPSPSVVETAPTPESGATLTCPTGVVTIEAPRWPRITVDPSYAATLRGLGMDDRLVPTVETNNRIEFTGGVIHNGTTGPIVISDVPDINLTGVSWATAYGWPAVSGGALVLAGESLGWGATGLSTFAIADVTGYTLDMTDVAVYWDDRSTVPVGCANPTVELHD